MGQSTGKVGRGTSLEIGADVASPSWAKVANVTNINITGRSSEEVDFTTLDSDGGYRETRQGLRDAGSVEFTVHFDPNDPTYVGTATSMVDLFESGDVIKVRVNFTGAGFNHGFIGRGYVMNPGDLAVENSTPIQGTVTIRLTGPLELVMIP